MDMQSHTSSAVIFPVYMLWAMQQNVSLRKGVGFSFIGIKKLNCMPASFLSYHTCSMYFHR